MQSMNQKIPQSTIPKKRWLRVLPAIFLMYCINMIDRNNIGFAFSGMQADLGLSASYAGLAGGIFAVGYIFMQIPGGLLAERWSSKKLIVVALVLWGLFATATGLIQSLPQLLIVRFMVGFVEGCILPAIVLLIKRWFPLSERARASGFWMLSIPFAAMIMSPLCGFILTHTTWRVMFIIEGILPIVFALVWWFAVEDHPSKAKWLSKEELAYIESAAAEESKNFEKVGENNTKISTWKMMLSRNVIILMMIWFLTQTGFAGYSIWLPSIMKTLTNGDAMTVGWLASLPWLIAMVTLTVNSRHSDKTGERRFHVIVPAVVSACFLLASTILASHGLVSWSIVSLVCCGGLIQCYYGIWWTIPTTFLTAEVLAVSLGAINAIGNLGGFFGPWLFGFFKEATGSSVGGMAFLVTASIIAPFLLLLLKVEKKENMQVRG